MIKMLLRLLGRKPRGRFALPFAKPDKDLMPKGTSEDALSTAGFFQLMFDRLPLEGVLVPSDINVAIVRRGRRNVLLLSGGDPDAKSHNETGGFSVRVPDTFEATVSGSRVCVKLSVRAAQGLADSEFSMAYSTAEVGNSRWQRMSVGNQFETMSFEWDVPTMISGNGDFVGILPGQAGAIEIAGLQVLAIARTEAQDLTRIPEPLDASPIS